MFRQIIVPTEKDHQIALPPEFYNKEVEVIAFEIESAKLESGKVQNDFLSDIEPIIDFPSIDQIRNGA